MKDKIKRSYSLSKNIYDDVLTQGSFLSRWYIRFFWQSVDDNQLAKDLLSWIDDDMKGRLLDVPTGTGVFTYKKYERMDQAKIVCLDYSEDMLTQAIERFAAMPYVQCVQGDVGQLPFPSASFDHVLSMNGFHAFPDKEKAYQQIYRVLKPGGLFTACFYVRGESRRTDWLVQHILAHKGWFTPPFETVRSVQNRLNRSYDMLHFEVRGSLVMVQGRKK